MTNYLRSNYRLSGGKIDDTAIAMGSSATSAAATAIGALSVAHGMGTTPTVAFASPYSADTFGAYRYVALKGAGSTYISFITASAPPAGSGGTVQATLIASALSSGLTISFTWAAIK